LESVFTRNRDVGSNPTLSARKPANSPQSTVDSQRPSTAPSCLLVVHQKHQRVLRLKEALRRRPMMGRYEIMLYRSNWREPCALK
jgi:hypothetical protein